MTAPVPPGEGGRIHLNTAGAGRLPAQALSAMTDYLTQEISYGAYETEAAHGEFFQHGIYRQIGTLVGADPADVALFDNATRGWVSVVPRLTLSAGDRVWVTPYEYAGNLIALQRMQARDGFIIEVIPTDATGDLDLDWVTSNLDDRVALVSVVHIPSAFGIVLPITEIGACLRGHRAFYAVDACQSVGQVPVDARAANCHLLTAAGRKFVAGPRGTGFAVVTQEARARLSSAVVDLHAAKVTDLNGHALTDATARCLELEERNFAGVIGLGVAIDLNLRRDAAAQALRFERIVAGLRQTGGVRVLAPGRRLSGIVSFVHHRIPARRLRDGLAERGVDVWIAVGAHTPLFMVERGIREAVRVSVGAHVTDADVDAFFIALDEVLRED